MQQNFELETILSVTNRINFTNDFNKIFVLFWFVYNNNHITTVGIFELKDNLTKHLLTIYPELASAIYKGSLENIDSWIAEQKIKFGEALPVCRIGETLETEERHR